jgi:hypothetical protein
VCDYIVQGWLVKFRVPGLGSVDLYRSTAWVLLSGPHLFPPPRNAGKDQGGGLNDLNDWNVWNEKGGRSLTAKLKHYGRLALLRRRTLSRRDHLFDLLESRR